MEHVPSLQDVQRFCDDLYGANTFSSLHRRIRLEGQITAANLQKVNSVHLNRLIEAQREEIGAILTRSDSALSARISTNVHHFVHANAMAGEKRSAKPFLEAAFKKLSEASSNVRVVHNASSGLEDGIIALQSGSLSQTRRTSVNMKKSSASRAYGRFPGHKNAMRDSFVRDSSHAVVSLDDDCNNRTVMDDHRTHDEVPKLVGGFVTARQLSDRKKKERNQGGGGGRSDHAPRRSNISGMSRYDPASQIKKTLGGKRRLHSNSSDNDRTEKRRREQSEQKADESRNPILDDPRMKNVDERMAEMILNEILDSSPGVSWSDIAGLEFAKSNVKEMVIYPMMRPDIFHGLRAPPKGLLLFGPPGTGKTMICKAIASEAGATFFNISASSLTSKWVGEGEKMVRALFTVARCHPAAVKVIFIDEVDSLLTQRSENDIEASRRIKTEFLVQMDGVGAETEPSDNTNRTDEAIEHRKSHILVIGATNRPQEIDEAARRRFVKRLYIPLPTSEARKMIIKNLLEGQSHSLTEEEMDQISEGTKGYSGSDMKELCTEAALGPIRGIDIRNISADSVRPIDADDFIRALRGIRASVSNGDLEGYLAWNDMYGSFGDVRNLPQT